MLKLFFAPSGRGCTIYTYISCHIALVLFSPIFSWLFLKFSLGYEYSQNLNIIPI
jgi:hypothetical protein